MRNTVFGAWLRDPNVNNPRRLAVQYGISIKRVEAIIRLKSHQNSLGKVCHCSDAPPVLRIICDECNSISLEDTYMVKKSCMAF